MCIVICLRRSCTWTGSYLASDLFVKLSFCLSPGTKPPRGRAASDPNQIQVQAIMSWYYQQRDGKLINNSLRSTLKSSPWLRLCRVRVEKGGLERWETMHTLQGGTGSKNAARYPRPGPASDIEPPRRLAQQVSLAKSLQQTRRATAPTMRVNCRHHNAGVDRVHIAEATSSSGC
jgi:hypothetical protein